MTNDGYFPTQKDHLHLLEGVSKNICSNTTPYPKAPVTCEVTQHFFLRAPATCDTTQHFFPCAPPTCETTQHFFSRAPATCETSRRKSRNTSLPGLRTHRSYCPISPIILIHHHHECLYRPEKPLECCKITQQCFTDWIGLCFNWRFITIR